MRRNFFASIFILKMVVKMNLRILTKNHAADPEIGFLTKSILKPYGRVAAMPTAWDSKNVFIRKRRHKLLYGFKLRPSAK